ncbi:MAG: lytic transglycosylase domain-containing protein [Bryobacteraceae bacterium]|nr:lytic transglycosylase domain-containing protein [Bryobacteraceae bacterium]
MKFLPLLFLTPSLFAGEYAVLRTGFRIHALRHEVAGSVTRIHTPSGTMEVPSTDVSAFEAEEYVAPPPPPPAPVATVAPAPVPVILTPAELLARAAEKHGLRPEFVASVAKAESAMRQDAVSPKGAIGLMQLMPGTAQELGVNPHDPAQNAEAGARYLKQLLEKYAGSPDPVRMALAAYNAGPGAVDRYGRIPPYAETQVYVERVLRKYLAELKSASSRSGS